MTMTIADISENDITHVLLPFMSWLLKREEIEHVIRVNPDSTASAVHKLVLEKFWAVGRQAYIRGVLDGERNFYDKMLAAEAGQKRAEFAVEQMHCLTEQLIKRSKELLEENTRLAILKQEYQHQLKQLKEELEKEGS